jgi:glucuronokinase
MDALDNEDHKRFAELMSQNFNLRPAVYGDATLSQANLRMIQLASEYNCVAKFPGSGYAIVNMWKGDDPARRSQDLRELRWALEKKDLYMLRLNPRLASNKNR